MSATLSASLGRVKHSSSGIEAHPGFFAGTWLPPSPEIGEPHFKSRKPSGMSSPAITAEPKLVASVAKQMATYEFLSCKMVMVRLRARKEKYDAADAPRVGDNRIATSSPESADRRTARA